MLASTLVAVGITTAQTLIARDVVAQRRFAKDIRIFGLTDWLRDVWESGCRLYRKFGIRKERHRLWIFFADMVFTFLRNGVAYAYLIRLTLVNGLTASEFLLYFNVVSGFTEWINQLLEQFSDLNRKSLEISILREFLEWPEPFRFEDGKPLKGEKPARMR